jgi:hypothetical protein
MREVRFVDTSVLCDLLDVPGKNQQRDVVRQELRSLVEDGVQLVLPIAAIIETGNHIANAAGDRRPSAERLQRFLELAASEDPPWQLHAVTWDAAFLAHLQAGDGTGMALVDHLGNGTMGTGDVAILCERDVFRARSSFRAVEIWTLEATLAAYS